MPSSLSFSASRTARAVAGSARSASGRDALDTQWRTPDRSEARDHQSLGHGGEQITQDLDVRDFYTRYLPAGRHRWTVERTVAWLSGCRRLHRRYERKAEHFLAFAGIAATLICYRRLAA
ncbi:transposase [Streptomyces sp. NPDC056165]|uniref:transposase n=1 Tax=Streptomyces sp. NPDC056165 TaxID=3345733 RepID=UPI0035E36A2A